MAEHGLSVADFDVLAALRRSGEPHELKPSDLVPHLMLSPAGMTAGSTASSRPGSSSGGWTPTTAGASSCGSTTPAGPRSTRPSPTTSPGRTPCSAPLSRREREALDDLLRRLVLSIET